MFWRNEVRSPLHFRTPPHPQQEADRRRLFLLRLFYPPEHVQQPFGASCGSDAAVSDSHSAFKAGEETGMPRIVFFASRRIPLYSYPHARRAISFVDSLHFRTRWPSASPDLLSLSPRRVEYTSLDGPLLDFPTLSYLSPFFGAKWGPRFAPRNIKVFLFSIGGTP